MTKLPQTMRGVLLTGHGGSEKLEFRAAIPVPRPGPRDVLLRVAAAGVNNTDINTRTGWYSKAQSVFQAKKFIGKIVFTVSDWRGAMSPGGGSRVQGG